MNDIELLEKVANFSSEQLKVFERVVKQLVTTAEMKRTDAVELVMKMILKHKP